VEEDAPQGRVGTEESAASEMTDLEA
jgi:hypothetical protein